MPLATTASSIRTAVVEPIQSASSMTVEHAIHITVPPETVWAVTSDVERWPDWLATVTSVRRMDAEPFGVGSVARIKQPAQPEAEWTVTEFDPPRRFVWVSSRPGLRFEAIHEVTPSGDGTTNRLSIEATGALAVLLWPILWPALRWALRQENEGLKRTCEAQRGA